MIYLGKNVASLRELPVPGGRACRAVMLFGAISGDRAEPYGACNCDFHDGMLLCCSSDRLSQEFPGNEFPAVCSRVLLYDTASLGAFSPGLPSGEDGFFLYGRREALHLSLRELSVLASCMDAIAAELGHTEDGYRMHIVAADIVCLLDHCLRFYERQFVTRELLNGALVRRYKDMVGRSLASGAAADMSQERCARRLGVSGPYLEDLLKFDIGMGHSEYVQRRRLETAKLRLRSTAESIGGISRSLGFPSTGYFCSLFKKTTGLTPSEYRYCKVKLFLLPSQADLKKN